MKALSSKITFADPYTKSVFGTKKNLTTKYYTSQILEPVMTPQVTRCFIKHMNPQIFTGFDENINNKFQ